MWDYPTRDGHQSIWCKSDRTACVSEGRHCRKALHAVVAPAVVAEQREIDVPLSGATGMRRPRTLSTNGKIQLASPSGNPFTSS